MEYVTLRKQTAKGIFPVQVSPERVLWHLENGYLPPEGVSEADALRSARLFFEQHTAELEKKAKDKSTKSNDETGKTDITPRPPKTPKASKAPVEKTEGVSEAENSTEEKSDASSEEQPSESENAQGAEGQ